MRSLKEDMPYLRGAKTKGKIENPQKQIKYQLIMNVLKRDFFPIMKNSKQGGLLPTVGKHKVREKK